MNEHHQTAYGLMPSPDVVASYLVARTSRAKVAILGNATPLRDHPLRVAEEVAMMDVMSGGRIICGFVRGIGPEYHNFTMNPATSLERFREAHDLIIESWTRPGPFRWEGKHYRFEYVNPWPRPLQQPHPPIWIPSQGSGETIDWASERRYTFIVTFTPFRNVARLMGQYREAARGFGYEAAPEQMGWALPVYVGATDESAIAEARPHAEYLFNQLVRRPLPVFFPPGYLSDSSAKGVLRAFSHHRHAAHHHRATERQLADHHRLRRDGYAPPARLHRRVRHRHARAPPAVRLDASRAGDRQHGARRRNGHPRPARPRQRRAPVGAHPFLPAYWGRCPQGGDGRGKCRTYKGNAGNLMQHWTLCELLNASPASYVIRPELHRRSRHGAVGDRTYRERRRVRPGAGHGLPGQESVYEYGHGGAWR